MPTKDNTFEELINQSDDKIISDNLFVINKYFKDIFEKYSFNVKTRTLEVISFENDYFEILFGYERNRYGIVDFNGVMIMVKASGKSYALNYIVDVLSHSSETFDDKFYSSSGMTGEETCRVLWNDHVDSTLKDPNPEWEMEIPLLLKQRFPDFFK